MFTTGMHGTEHCDRKRRTLRLSAPRPPGFPATGLTLPDAPQACSQSGPDARNGLSLARNGCPSRGHHSRVKVPGLLLRFPAYRFFCPFDLRLYYRIEFALSPAASSPQARCRITGSPDLPRFPFPLPVGIFASVRIKAFHGTRCPSIRLPTSPDLRSLPTTGFYY